MKIGKHLRTLALVAAVAGVAASGFAQKQHPPQPGKAKDFHVPKPRVIALENGMHVTLVPWGATPKLSVRLAVRTGNIDESASQVWLSDVIGDLLTQGTSTRTASQIAQQAADMGGEIRVGVGDDQVNLTTDVLSEFGPDAVRLLADIVRNPSFPEAEIKRIQTDRLRQLSIARSQQQQLAQEKFRALLYGDHPYGRLFPTAETIQGFTISEVRGFYDANYGAQRAHIYVVGHFDGAAMEKAIRAAFSGWKKGAAASVHVPTARSERRLEVLDRPAAVQSTIYIGMPTIDPSNADWIGLEVMDSLLGGSFGSRITSNIREQKGYTYSPHSQLSSRFRDGYWVEIADVTTKDTGASLKEIFAEIDRLQAEPPAAAELRGIQNYLAGLFVLQNSTRYGIIGQLEFMDLHGLPEDYLNTYVQKIYAVTPAEIQRLATKHIQDDRATIVIAGDQKVIAEQVAPYAKPPAAPAPR